MAIMFRNTLLTWLLACLCLFFTAADAQQDSSCGPFKQCQSGCCNEHGQCGFGPDYCGDGCQGSCDAMAECGEYASEGEFDCPLNVCCSGHGFCGTAMSFCNENCQNKGGCPEVEHKTCSESSDAMDSEVRIAYYGAWGADRDCDSIQPENIPAGVLTHIYVSFEGITEDYEITDDIGDIVARTSRLKRIYPGLKVVIAIGGWAFNDPPTQYRFSNMASTRENRETFIKSLIQYILRYSLDGVDIDWEYPVAGDRGGVPEDFDNFVKLISEIKGTLDMVDPGWEVTLTLPSSYWYLRGFDIVNLEEQVDWFNLMSYDIHGVWDEDIEWTGPYLKPHTNISEIDDGLDLLWRNGISPEKVVMGYGFYGRGFTMADTSCDTAPNCEFTGPSEPGSCTNEGGILSFSEIMSRKKEVSTEIHFDEEYGYKYMIYGTNQWISFDDAESFEIKKKFQSSRCLKGLMIWSADLDTPNFDAMHALFGSKNMADALSDTSLTDKEKEQLVDELSVYTGQNCYIPDHCTSSASDADWRSGCLKGFRAVEMAHAPLRIRSDKFQGFEKCDEGEFHFICCPDDQMPKNCEWTGAPDTGLFPTCDGECGESQFELASDAYQDHKGGDVCWFGRRRLCCDSTDFLHDCAWQPCGDDCADDHESVATRRDGLGGSECDDDKERKFCCPKDKTLDECIWSNDPLILGGGGDVKDSTKDYITCNNKECSYTKLAVTTALLPGLPNGFDIDDCAAYPQMGVVEPGYNLCCDPPSPFDRDLPVDPSFLWSDYHPEDGSDNVWKFSNNFGNNNQDNSPDYLRENPGEDPYGFIILNGPEGSLDNDFADTFTVVDRLEPRGLEKRSLVTTNQTVLDHVFDDVQETIHVYCNRPHDSAPCRKPFYKGGSDTIIRLPDHVGEGPFARIVSMERVENPVIPEWAHRKRSLGGGNQNGIYKLTFDYNFAAIQAEDDEQVNMRVDYTNLMEYWDEVTDEPVERRRRSTGDPFARTPFEEWRSHVDRAKKRDLKKNGYNEKRAGQADFSPDESTLLSTRSLERRWFGAFKGWLAKLNSIVKDESGFLPMGFKNMLTLYSGRLECESDDGISFRAGLDVTADLDFDMRTQYAYYFSGTIVPPKVIDTYAYIGAHPKMQATITVAGEAQLEYTSKRVKIIDTLTYPGLAIKGIAAVGPSLDLWGQIHGEVTVAGSMTVGAKYTFEPIELYMPNDDETRNRATKDLQEHDVKEEGLEPVFDAEVEAAVGFGVRVTPEVNMGLKIGGGFGNFKKTLLDAHISTFVNTTLWFYAEAQARLSSGWSYEYGVQFFYRIGFSAIVDVILLGGWETGQYYPWEQQLIDLYGPKTVTSSDSALIRRSESLYHFPEPLRNPLFEVPKSVYNTPNLYFDDEFDLVENTTYYLNLTRRQDEGEDNQDGKFKYGNFECVYGNGDACSDTTIETRRRDLATRAPDTECPRKLPRLFYNCVRYFADFTLQPPQGAGGSAVTIPGLCTSVQKFLDSRRGLPYSRGTGRKWILTWDSDQRRTNKRRRQSCPTGRVSGFCRRDNARKRQTVWAANPPSTELTNCDEFPFAGSEEGGRTFYGLDSFAAGGTARTCVPNWQNEMQGQCNKLLSKLETNVMYYNDLDNPNQGPAQWETWSAHNDGWVNDLRWPQVQRRANYPSRNPQAKSAGIQPSQHANGQSWYHKRNFTINLVYPTTPGGTNVAFPGTDSVSGRLNDKTETQWVNGKKRRITVQPAKYDLQSGNQIICAVDTNHQERFRVDGSNGWCWDGQRVERQVWDAVLRVYSYFSCRVDFSARSGASKRDRLPIGYLGDTPYYSITKIEGTEREIVVPVEDSTGDEYYGDEDYHFDSDFDEGGDE